VYLTVLSAKMYNAAEDWLDAWQQLKDGAGLPDSLREVIEWADRIVDFIANLDDWFERVIRRMYPEGLRILRDPIGEILRIFLRETGFDSSLLYDTYNRIRQVVRNVYSRLDAIADDPDGWLIRTVEHFFPLALDILRDPDGWIIDRINVMFPSLAEFIRDPDDYIVDHFITWLDKTLDRYESRITKIAENILNRIF